MEDKTTSGNWVSLYGDYLFSIALMKLRERETAKDLLQETFLSAYKNRHQFRGESSEKTWLTSILKNKIIDWYRANKRNEEVINYLLETDREFINTYYETSDAQFGHIRQEAWQTTESADKNLKNKEIGLAIHQCAEKLPKKIAPIFLAKFIDEKKADEICKDFNISTSNYWVIIHRAKVYMQNCLKKKGILE